MTDLLPLFKWTGGKRKEIPHFSPYYPEFLKTGKPYTLVEPFVGAGAVYWNLNNLAGNNIINDFDGELANFLQQVKIQNQEFLNLITESAELYGKNKRTNQDHDTQEANYYKWRNLDRGNGLLKLTPAERAARFWIVNQLAFSGMRRFNKAGEFNVPYGHYTNLNPTNLTNPAHVKLLQNTEIFTGDYKPVVENNDTRDTFIFLDPPYTRVMKKYSADNEFGDREQEELAETLKSLKRARWMLIIDKSPLTQRLYKEQIKHTYGLSYGVNIKNRFNTGVEHIIATNY